MELSICIVNWNAGDYLLRCLASIKKNLAGVTYEVLIVDNFSSDDSSEKIQKNFPEFVFIQNNENKGFAFANNQALTLAQGKWIFFLNPDTEIVADSIQKLMQYAALRPDVGIVAPKLLNADGSTQHSIRRFPNFKTAFYRYTLCKKIGLFSKEEALNKMTGCDFSRTQSVEQPAGAALLMKKEILNKVGWMDPQFFLFYEEVDLCYRVKKRGYDIVYFPDAVVVHYSGKSRQKNRQNIFLPTLRSMFYYFSKHRGDKKTRYFKWIFKPLFIVSTIGDVCEEYVSHWLYRMKKDEYRANRKKDLYVLKSRFLRNDLKEFLFQL